MYRRECENGFSTVLIMMLLGFTLILGGTLLNRTLNEFKFADIEEKQLQAYYIAKSGADLLGTAIEGSLISPEDIIEKSSNQVSLGQGTLEVSVSKNGNIIKISSTGTVDNLSDTVVLELSPISGGGGGPDFDMGLFTLENINFDGGTINGDVGTNMEQAGSVQLDWGSTLNGDLYVGPDGNPEEVLTMPDYYGDINGTKRNLSEIRDYTLPEYPEFPEEMDTLSGRYEAGWWPSPPYYLDENLWKDEVLVKSELVVDVYDEDLIIGANTLKVDGSGKITVNCHGSGKLLFYVKDSFILNNSGSINKSGDNENVVMYYSGATELNPSGDTKFSGSVYAENADITISGSGGITGHIITGGESVDITGDASAYVRAIFAPNAEVSLTGSGHTTGAIVAKTANLYGGCYINYDNGINDTIPEELGLSGDNGYERTWK